MGTGTAVSVFICLWECSFHEPLLAALNIPQIIQTSLLWTFVTNTDLWSTINDVWAKFQFQIFQCHCLFSDVLWEHRLREPHLQHAECYGSYEMDGNKWISPPSTLRDPAGYDPKNSTASVTDFRQIPVSDDSLMFTMAKIGPIFTDVDDNSSSFQFYECSF